MTELERLFIAKHQVSNVIQLIKDNPYEQYMNLKLTSVYFELQRQIENYGKKQ